MFHSITNPLNWSQITKVILFQYTLSAHQRLLIWHKLETFFKPNIDLVRNFQGWERFWLGTTKGTPYFDPKFVKRIPLPTHSFLQSYNMNIRIRWTHLSFQNIGWFHRNFLGIIENVLGVIENKIRGSIYFHWIASAPFFLDTS